MRRLSQVVEVRDDVPELTALLACLVATVLLLRRVSRTGQIRPARVVE